VIASNTGGLRDIVVHGESGLLVSPGDRPALRGAVEQLLRDPALRERMGAAGAKRAEHFRPDAIVPKFEDSYRLAIEARRARQSAR
jgi:glycosyltransferase involved in cell wall biosynthesis